MTSAEIDALIARLNAESATWHVPGRYIVDDPPIVHLLLEAAATLAALKADGERLDWLESHKAMIEQYTDGQCEVSWSSGTRGHDRVAQKCFTIRAAIDAARAEKP